MKSNFEAWWPVIKVIFELVFSVLIFIFMLLAMSHGAWNEAIFWLLMITLGKLDSIKDKL